MAIDFPNSPSTNDTYTVGNKTWIYDGTTWNTYNSTTFSAETLPGTTIKSTVTGSSLTSVGALTSLDVQATTGTAMRITNVGTGYSLLVEDSASTDTTPFVIDSSGQVGIGTANPQAGLGVFGSPSVNPVLRINNAGAGPCFLVEDTSGTDSTPFIIDAAGLVGIGKLTPTVPLDVVGAISSTGAVTATDFAISTKSMPRNSPGWQRSTTTPVTITTEATQLSFSITAVTNRIYRITYFEPQIASPATSGAFLTAAIKTGATKLSGSILQNDTSAASMNSSTFVTWTGTLTAGAQTISATLTSGVGSWAVARSATTPNILTVEDLGT